MNTIPTWIKATPYNTNFPHSVFIRWGYCDRKNSWVLASEFDEFSIGCFCYRDFTEGGIPFIPKWNIYESDFRFELEVDAKTFYDFAKHFNEVKSIELR